MLETLRSGAFLTRERMRLVGFALLASYAAALVYLSVTANGLLDSQGRPLGTDFSNVYAAGTLALDGHPRAPFDPALQYAREQAIFGANTPFYGWHYPPFFLFIAATLALLPYVPALLLWQGTTLLLYVFAIRMILVRPAAASEPPRLDDNRTHSRGRDGASAARRLDPLWLLLALAFPAVFVNLGHGHNGFLTAAIIATALCILDRRPLLAGLLFGLLVYKPQFGVLIPLVLITTGRWKTFAAAACTVAVLVFAVTFAFGVSVWDAFLASTHFTRTIVLEAGETGWHKIQSVFAWVRMWGGPIPLAYGLQAVTTLALATALVWQWRARCDFALRAAALVTAATLATPYSLDYDMMTLAPAIAFVVGHGLQQGFSPYEKTALAALWIVPLVARAVAETTFLPVGVLTMGAMLGLTLRRSARACGAMEKWHSSHYPVG